MMAYMMVLKMALTMAALMVVKKVAGWVVMMV